MSKINNSNWFFVSCIFLCLIAFLNTLSAQPNGTTQTKTRIVLCVTSKQPAVPVVFEFTIIKDGKKGKIQILKTPFKKTYEIGNMIFVLKKIRGKSNIMYKITNIDCLNRETGNSSSTGPNVKFIIKGENVSVSSL